MDDRPLVRVVRQVHRPAPQVMRRVGVEDDLAGREVQVTPSLLGIRVIGARVEELRPERRRLEVAVEAPGHGPGDVVDVQVLAARAVEGVASQASSLVVGGLELQG